MRTSASTPLSKRMRKKKRLCAFFGSRFALANHASARHEEHTIRSGTAGLVTCPLIGTLRRVDEIIFKNPLPTICELAPPIPRRPGTGATADREQWIRNQEVNLTLIPRDSPSYRFRILMFNEIETSRDKIGQGDSLDAPRRPQGRRIPSQVMGDRARSGQRRERPLLHERNFSNSHVQDRTRSSQDDALGSPRRRQARGHSCQGAAGKARRGKRRNREPAALGNFRTFSNFLAQDRKDSHAEPAGIGRA